MQSAEDIAMDVPTSTAPSDTIAEIVANALKQQASHFEAVIACVITHTTTGSQTTPRNSKLSSPAAASKSPKTPKTLTPTRKRHPLQVMVDDTPKDFKSCKEALYVHIKMMWGLYKPSDVPPTPNAALLKEFYTQFNSSEEIESVVNNPASTTAKIFELRTSGRKIARGLGHIDEIAILYMSSILAKLLAVGTYNYMNVNLKHANSLSLITSVYNHYVHFVMAAKYKTERNNAGKVKKQCTKKTIQKNRERLCDTRSEFLMRHWAKFPPRYRKVCSDILAHSDNEYDAEKHVLDVEILKEEELNGKTSQKQIRKLPKTPAVSEFSCAPKNLSIDFYNPNWFNELPPAQKQLMTDTENVAFLPDATQSLLPTRHPDKKLGDAKFTAKYLDVFLEAYNLSDDEGEDDFAGTDEDEDVSDVSLNSDSEAEEEDEEESEFYEEGEYGDLYDEAKEDGDHDV
ncbi:hypothetical protein CROQUDRAFT_99491 [Cronartium quercuum f. sp. fusiforme G11]|uniref:Uncharacterized protein n=1 Tax=Cronartium quercuum f. sp. fusiforme G11 TaxID=708437 RepID=A0A9P6N751_9BASI|nr:hypothetical protein CROQUDRAFT_99491 [Cronartium quercuum f. sp. fusiforme G11]